MKPERGIFIKISKDYVPEDGTVFEAMISVLEHFEIPATLEEGFFIKVDEHSVEI